MSRRLAPTARRGDSGAVAVEFALIVPILLLLVFGLIQYGFYFLASQSGSDAVRSAVRASSVSAPPSCTTLRQTISNQVAGVGSNALVTREYRDADRNGELNIGDEVWVSLTFTSRDLGLPLLPFVADGRVQTDAVARVEYLDVQPLQDCP